MARRSRKDRRSTETVGGAIPSPYIQRSVPHFDVLDEAQLQQLDQQVDWLIENIGVAFRDDPVALDIWRAAGVTPTGEHGVGYRGTGSRRPRFPLICDLCDCVLP